MGNKITPLVVNPGRVVLTDAILYFQPYNNAEANPVIKIKLTSIKRIFQRRFLANCNGLRGGELTTNHLLSDSTGISCGRSGSRSTT